MDLDAFTERVTATYRADIVAQGKAEQFWILLAFVITFLVTRAVTAAIHRSRIEVRGVRIRDIHVHHLVPGIIGLIVTGYVTVAYGWSGPAPAIAFGTAAALTLDEFALWLHLEDVYWSDRGRHSVRVVLGAASVAALLLVHLGFWRHVADAAGAVLGIVT
jgi:hypothetical protein